MRDLRAVHVMESAAELNGLTPDDQKKLASLFDSLVLKYPQNGAIRNARGEFLWVIDEKTRAEADWRAAAELDPKNADVLDHLGGCAVDAGEIKDGVRYFERAIAATPERALFHFHFANVLWLFRNDIAGEPAQNMERALGQYAEAVRIEPLNEEFLRSYGETFYLLPKPDWQTALPVWEKYLQVTEHKDFALTNLARVHLRLGQKTEALACLAEIQAPEFRSLKARLEAQCRQN